MENGRIRALGIDLGTTNSAVTEIVWDPASGQPPALCTLEIEQPTREGVYTSPLVPSVVAVLPDGRVWVGEGAKRLRAFPTEYGLSFEKNLFYDTKNEMGLRKTYCRAPSP
jgi:molecular chaperone DnaK (HSP70)